MRKYIIIFVTMAVLIFASYAVTYTIVTMQNKKQQRVAAEKEKRLEELMQDNENTNKITEEQLDEDETLVTVDVVSQKITETTKIIIYNHYIDNDITTEEIIFASTDMVGMDRIMFSEYLNNNILGAVASESGKELVSTEVLKFSNESITIRNNYMGLYQQDAYKLVNENNCIVVYEQDDITIKEKTNIVVDLLPLELQEELEDGKIIYGEEELNRFLENYGS